MAASRKNLLKQRDAPAPMKKATPKPPDDENDVPEQEKDAVQKLLSEIDRAKSITKDFNEKTLPMLRRLSWGTYSPDKGESVVRSNMIFATQATLLPHIYAKNPEISVTPTEAVSEKEYGRVKEFAKTCEILINKLLIDEAGLKRRMKSGVRSAMTTSVGWFKLSLQHSLTADDPIILQRANDLQDNLQRIEYLISSLKDETGQKEANTKREELQQQLQALMQADEVKIFKGFTLDRVRTEDMFILDESVVEFDGYVTARKLSHRVFMSEDQYCQTFHAEKVPKGYTKYPTAGGTPDNPTVQSTASGNTPKVNYVAVHEVWDHSTNMLSVVCEGAKGYARKPRVMKHTPERWHGFYALGYNLVEGRWRPLSDVELLQYLQEEYNTTRYLYAEARKEAIPVRVFRKGGGLTEEDIDRLTKRRARDFIGVEGNPSSPLANDLMQMEGVKIDPAAYDVTLIRNDMDMMVGLSDASRANLIQAKTATEAEIMQQSLMNRVAERQDTTEDLITDMAVAVLQTALQAFTPDEVRQLVGEGSAWVETLADPAEQMAPGAAPAVDPATGQPAPVMPAAPAEPAKVDIETIFRKVRVSVKAGTTGKPNQVKERETWAQLMPILNETMTKVAELRAAGQFELADSVIELAKEALRRYDEKIDIDRFIKPAEIDPATGQPKQAQNGIQAAAQAQEQLQAMQDELGKLQEALAQCQMDLKTAKQAEQARIAEAEAGKAVDVARETSKTEMARIEKENERALDSEQQAQKLQNEREIAMEKIQNERELEEMRIASQERIAMGKIKSAEDIAATNAATKVVGADDDRDMKRDVEAGKQDVARETAASKAAAPKKPASKPDATAKPELSVDAIVKAVEASMAKSRPKSVRVVVGANGLPERLVAE